MENIKNQRLNKVLKPNLSNNKKLNPKIQPESFKVKLQLLRDKALGIVNNFVDYVLDNTQELYNNLTNSFPKNELNNYEPIHLNEEYVAQELINKAKQDGDTKEVYLDNKHPNNPNMVGSSLVIDMDLNKIEATINQLNENINSKSMEKSVEPEVQNKNEIKAGTRVNNTNESSRTPKQAFKLNLESPKPTPKNNKKDKLIDISKTTISSSNIQNTIEAMRNKFIKNQEENPTILEEQKYETVLKPQEPIFIIKNKDSVNNNIFLLRGNNINEPTPDIIEDHHGVEQRKIKSRLK